MSLKPIECGDKSSDKCGKYQMRKWEIKTMLLILETVVLSSSKILFAFLADKRATKKDYRMFRVCYQS